MQELLRIYSNRRLILIGSQAKPNIWSKASTPSQSCNKANICSSMELRTMLRSWRRMTWVWLALWTQTIMQSSQLLFTASNCSQAVTKITYSCSKSTPWKGSKKSSPLISSIVSISWTTTLYCADKEMATFRSFLLTIWEKSRTSTLNRLATSSQSTKQADPMKLSWLPAKDYSSLKL